MNFFKKNVAFTACLVITLLLSGWLGWKVFSMSGDIADMKMDLDEEQDVVRDLKEKTFSITNENVELTEQNLKTLKETIADIKTGLASYAIKVADMDKVEFQSYLRTTLDQLKKELADKKIAISPKYQDLSFKVIKENSNPSKEDIKIGLTRLRVLKELVSKLPAQEGGAAFKSVGVDSIESVEWGKTGPVTSKTGAVTYIPLELRVVGNQGALRPFINGVVSSENLFMIIRSIEFNNPVSFGVKVKDAKAAKPVQGTEAAKDDKEYKEDREIVSNNKVDWKLYIDVVQINDVKPN